MQLFIAIRCSYSSRSRGRRDTRSVRTRVRLAEPCRQSTLVGQDSTAALGEALSARHRSRVSVTGRSRCSKHGPRSKRILGVRCFVSVSCVHVVIELMNNVFPFETYTHTTPRIGIPTFAFRNVRGLRLRLPVRVCDSCVLRYRRFQMLC